MTITKEVQAVTKDMPIAEVVEKYPMAVPVILSYGLHCVGCHVSPFETVEQGAMGHGMTEHDVESMVKDINDAIADSARGAPVKLTELAAAKLVEFIAAEGRSGEGLRVMVMPGGNAGYTYDMQFEAKANPEDEVFEDRGVKIFVERNALELLRGSTIDFLEDVEGGGFKVNNPNKKGGCGCGSGGCGCGTGQGSGGCGCSH